MMKLLFICGSLEVGKDGVGDYTRRLGMELVNQGHEVKLISLNDTVTEEHLEHITININLQIEVIRFPSSLSWEHRMARLEMISNLFSPNWISLQYVPYSFQNKGIPFKFVRSLKQIDKKWRWHIMFHETWIGISSLSTRKHKLVGFAQRKMAKMLIESLKPERVSTSNRLYQIILTKADIPAEILPIFSNIPLITTRPEFGVQLLKNLQINFLTRNDYTVLGIFGRLHEGHDLHPVISEEFTKASLLNKKLVFVSFGRIGDLAEFNRLKSIFQSKVNFVLLGELPEEEVSNMLQMLDVAISCTPLEHIGKSGVYAAMRLHNVKVLLPFSDKIPELESEIKEYNNYLNSRPLHKWGVDYVAHKFVKSLIT